MMRARTKLSDTISTIAASFGPRERASNHQGSERGGPAPLSYNQYPSMNMKRVAGDFMSAEFIYVGPETKLTRVLELIVDHRVRSMPVINDDQRVHRARRRHPRVGG